MTRRPLPDRDEFARAFADAARRFAARVSAARRKQQGRAGGLPLAQPAECVAGLERHVHGAWRPVEHGRECGNCRSVILPGKARVAEVIGNYGGLWISIVSPSEQIARIAQALLIQRDAAGQVQQFRFVRHESQAVFHLRTRSVELAPLIGAPCLLQRFARCCRHAPVPDVPAG